MAQLEKYFEGLFGLAKTLFQLTSKLANKQENEENVVEYTYRIGTLKKGIDCHSKKRRQIQA